MGNGNFYGVLELKIRSLCTNFGLKSGRIFGIACKSNVPYQPITNFGWSLYPRLPLPTITSWLWECIWSLITFLLSLWSIKREKDRKPPIWLNSKKVHPLHWEISIHYLFYATSIVQQTSYAFRVCIGKQRNSRRCQWEVHWNLCHRIWCAENVKTEIL